MDAAPYGRSSSSIQRELMSFSLPSCSICELMDRGDAWHLIGAAGIQIAAAIACVALQLFSAMGAAVMTGACLAAMALVMLRPMPMIRVFSFTCDNPTATLSQEDVTQSEESQSDISRADRSLTVESDTAPSPLLEASGATTDCSSVLEALPTQADTSEDRCCQTLIAQAWRAPLARVKEHLQPDYDLKMRNGFSRIMINLHAQRTVSHRVFQIHRGRRVYGTVRAYLTIPWTLKPVDGVAEITSWHPTCLKEDTA